MFKLVLSSYINGAHKNVINKIITRKTSEKRWHETVNICGTGVKPKRLREEEYFGKKETELYEKLKYHDEIHLGASYNLMTNGRDCGDDVHCVTNRDFSACNKVTNKREEDFFHQYSLEGLQILTAKKQCGGKSKNKETVNKDYSVTPTTTTTAATADHK